MKRANIKIFGAQLGFRGGIRISNKNLVVVQQLDPLFNPLQQEYFHCVQVTLKKFKVKIIKYIQTYFQEKYCYGKRTTKKSCTGLSRQT